MFERFTDKARSVVTAAQDEARAFGANHLDTEHLLAAMLAIGSGKAYDALTASGVTLEHVRSEASRLVATPGGPLGDEDAAALRTIGIDLDAVMESVEGAFGPGALSQDESSGRRTGHIPFTKRAKKTLELSLREALRLHHDYIGTEHLLLGLIRQSGSPTQIGTSTRDGGVAIAILVENGVDLSDLRNRIEADLIVTAKGSGRRRILARMRFAAREVVERAKVEADGAGVSYVGTEHLLVGLAAIEDGPAYSILAGAGLTVERVRSAVAASATNPGQPGWTQHEHTPWSRPWRIGTRMSDRARHVLVVAASEAQQLGSSRIGMEHVLLALVQEDGSMGSAILRDAGLSAEGVRAALRPDLGNAA